MSKFWTSTTALAGLLLVAICSVPQMSYAKAQDATVSQADIAKGKALAFGRGKGNCLACHQIEGGKLVGNVGPTLVNMKERYPNRDVLFKRIWDETQFNPQTVMPPFGRNKILTKKEINYIIDFLYTR